VDLFERQAESSSPLADRMRPTRLEDVVGQSHLLGEGHLLPRAIQADRIPSMILWGPPGTGKTTLANVIANETASIFVPFSAVLGGVPELRKLIASAKEQKNYYGKKTILFVDEIHRFNKAQQDALLPHVENGTVTLIGATTENPSFEVIAPLLSRSQVYVMHSLGKEDLGKILDHALTTDVILSKRSVVIEDPGYLMLLSGGDARKLLNGLETSLRLTPPNRNGSVTITKQKIEEAFQKKYSLYDKGGEQHYDIISAFIKSVRGSDPDAAVYWMARMLDGGEDPKFIARRMIVLASEDIGNADPFGIVMATSCFTAIDYIGMPEARIVLAQTATYLAAAPKSNASYLAIDKALADVRNLPNLPVPLHVRNAPTKLMEELGYGKDYKYSHDYESHFSEQQYLPDNLKDALYYKPTDMGKERELRERLNSLWKKKQR
jgi:putative ATPase